MIINLMALLIFLTLLYFMYFITKQAKQDLFRPITIAGIVFIWYYMFDILYALWDFKHADSFKLSNYSFTYNEKSLVITGLIIFSCVWAWIIGDKFSEYIFNKRKKNMKPIEYKANFKNNFNSHTTIIFLGLISLALMSYCLFSFVQFIYSLGGFSWYFDNIASRSLIFGNASTLYSLIQLVSTITSIVCGLLWVYCKTIKFSAIIFIITLMLFCLLVITGLLTGARVTLIKDLFIIAFVWNYYANPIRFNLKLIAGLFLIAFLGILFVQETRYNKDSISNSSTIDQIFNTVEVSQANNIYLIYQYNAEGIIQGKSIISGLFAAIPKNVMNSIGIEKEKGANAYFTNHFWPQRWKNSKSEVALGIVGEFGMNFGFYLTPFLLLIISFLYRSIYELILSSNWLQPWSLLLNLGVVWSSFQLLRGDLFNTTISLAVFIVAVIILASITSIFQYSNQKSINSNYEEYKMSTHYFKKKGMNSI